MKNLTIFAFLLASCALFADDGLPNSVGTTKEGCSIIVGQDRTVQILCKDKDGKSLDAHAVVKGKNGQTVDSVTGSAVNLPSNLQVTYDDHGRAKVH